MPTDHPPEGALAAYTALAQELYRRAATSYTKIADAIGSDRYTVSAALRGHQHQKPKRLPVDHVVAGLDRELHGEGQLIYLWQVAKAEDAAKEAKLALPEGGLLPILGRTVVATRGVGATDRRQLFEVGGLTAATVLAATGAVSDQIDAARPATFTLTELEAQLVDLNRDLCAVAPSILFPGAFKAWQQVEGMLARRVQLAVAPRLTRLAGQFAAELATVARFGGDSRLGRRFAAIAEEHATAVNDPLLTGRVAGLQSWIAMDAGHWATAADFAAKGRRDAHPGQRARLAAYEALAASAAGAAVQAEEAIVVMRASMRTAIKGDAEWNDAEEDLYTALTAANTVGAGRTAIHHGERAAATFVHDNQGVGLAMLAVATGHLDGDHANPGAASASGIAALDAVADSPNAVVEQRARALHRQLAPWQREGLVQKLGRRVAAV
ncbi:hypothetical protein [Frankia sp. BMG5.23]|uniref:hypothetical protein n=1 Tax=Frankia sp. BMG5.23 TaxID=683305 RepID=UPI0004617813|nr:hypothetical protein [Frankia sp. BMG5.23]KDA44870.1 hypothetical protein BMG523Draft_00394 [Frankia sp. BMG5.23]